MSPNKRQGSKLLKRFLLAGISVAVLLLVLWMIIPRLEGKAPEVNWVDFNRYIGASSAFSLEVSDNKSGLRKVWAALLVDGREHVLIDYPGDRPDAGPVVRKRFDVIVEPFKISLSDGPAVLRLVARDYSWRDWGKGNRTYIEKEVIIDTRKPDLEMISRNHYINQGGAGLAVYRVAEADITHGVQVGDVFFPGYAGAFKDKYICLAFFAVAHDQDVETPIYISAVDRAGNSTRAGFYYRIRSRQFPSDRLVISDNFLRHTLPEFSDVAGESPAEKFITVNSEMRRENDERIRSLCRKTEPVLHWQGAFLRFPNSAQRAGFADHRTYVYQDRVIGESYHLGVDLASLSNSPVPAANHGRVVFTGDIGIYGRTVIVDHGFGLFSLYSHLSSIAVGEGQTVKLGEMLGRSGISGLAAGDHLHFSMLVHGMFVNPLEWWDASWIQNNITTKIETARQMERDGAWSGREFR